MLEMIGANWLVFILALLVGLVVAWWIFARGSSGGDRQERKPDALDEGAPPAQRNQALIDAPPAAELTPMAGAGTMAGVGEVVAVAAQDEIKAQTRQDASASPPPKDPVPPAPTPPESSAAAKAEAAPAAAAAGGDDLRRLKGVGPKLAALLRMLDVTSFAQIASWDEADIDRIDAQLGTFSGRIRRDDWVEQARLLQTGDTAAYEAKFGKL